MWSHVLWIMVILSMVGCDYRSATCFFPHALPASDFEPGSAGELSLPRVSQPLKESGQQTLPSLCWYLFACRRDVHLSSSLINNYSLCGPKDRL